MRTMLDPVPPYGNGIRYTLSPSWKASHAPSGDTAASSASGSVKWTRRSLPSRRIEAISVPAGSPSLGPSVSG